MISKHRVLQVVTHLAQGGAERVCFTLMRALRDQFEFGLLAVRGTEASDVGRAFRSELDELGIPFYEATKVSIKHGGMAFAGLAMARACGAFKPDLIHLHTEIPESTYAAMTVLPTRWRRVPLVRTIHNTVLWTPWRKMGRWCERHMTDSHIAAVSNAALDAYRMFRAETNPKPLPSAPLVIFNGVSSSGKPRATPLQSDSAVADHSTEQFTKTIRLVFAGRLELQKSADLLPDIIRQTRRPNDRAIDLTIFGDGTFREALNQLASNAPAGWTIRVLPPIPDLRNRFAEFDFAIMPSRYEGFGLVAVEALMESLPVIATDAPGLREVFPKNYPWLAAPGDATAFAEALSRALANSADERDAVLRDAMSFATAHFSVVAMAEQYAQLFARILQAPR